MKKYLKILTAFVLVLGLLVLPIQVNAEENYTEWTSDNTLPTSGQYKLMNDVTLSTKITIGGWASSKPQKPSKTLVLDLNGHTIKTTDGQVFFVQASGGLTIEDSSDNKTGKITNEGCSGVKHLIQNNGGELTIKGGTIENTTSSGYAVHLNNSSNSSFSGGTINNSGKSGYAVLVNTTSNLTISGATIVNNVSGGKALHINGSGTVTLENGKIQQLGTYGSDSAVYLNNRDGKFVMNGGTIVSESNGIEAYWSKVEINKGEINAKNYAFFTRNLNVSPENNDDVKVIAEKAVIYDLSNSKNIISGGTFSAPSLVKSYTSTQEDKPQISGGVFSCDVNDSFILDDTLTKIEQPDGTIIVAPKATSITLSPTVLKLEVSDSNTASSQLKAIVEPEGVLTPVVWTSSDEKVATVDENGKVTAVSAGKATITAKVGDCTATCEVTVKEHNVVAPVLPEEPTEDVAVAPVVDADAEEMLKKSANKEFENELKNALDIETEVVVTAQDEKTTPAKDITAVESLVVSTSASKRTEVVQYLDLSIIVKADGEKVGNVTSTTKPLTFNVKLSEDLMKDGRTFKVVRVHDDKAEVLDSTLKDGVITFETDKFSTYAIVTEEEIETVKVTVKGVVDGEIVEPENAEDGTFEVEKGTYFTEGELKELEGLKDLFDIEGYTFKGFFMDKEGAEALKANVPMNEDTTIYMIWNKNTDITVTPDDSNKPTTPTETTKPVETPEKGEKVETGDNSAIVLYGSICALAVVGAGIVALKKKREKLLNK